MRETHLMAVHLEVFVVRDVLLDFLRFSGPLRASFKRLSMDALVVSIEESLSMHLESEDSQWWDTWTCGRTSRIGKVVGEGSQFVRPLWL